MSCKKCGYGDIRKIVRGKYCEEHFMTPPKDMTDEELQKIVKRTLDEMWSTASSKERDLTIGSKTFIELSEEYGNFKSIKN